MSRINADIDQTITRYVTARTVNVSTVSRVNALICSAVVVSSGYAMAYISDVFLSTLMYVLIDDGSAMRPPIGSVTFRNVASRPNPSAKPASRYRVGTASNPAEVLRVERASPDHHGQPGDRERVESEVDGDSRPRTSHPQRREPEVEEEDLDEDRRVPDDLDVHRRELAHDGDAVRPSRAEHEPDEERTDDRDRGDGERSAQAGRELVLVLLDERPEVAEERGDDRELDRHGGRSGRSRGRSHYVIGHRRYGQIDVSRRAART